MRIRFPRLQRAHHIRAHQTFVLITQPSVFSIDGKNCRTQKFLQYEIQSVVKIVTTVGQYLIKSCRVELAEREADFFSSTRQQNELSLRLREYSQFPNHSTLNITWFRNLYAGGALSAVTPLTVPYPENECSRFFPSKLSSFPHMQGVPQNGQPPTYDCRADLS